MNIFFLHEDPVVAAQYHVDKHCVKMILESCQLLCNYHWERGIEAPYKKTHFNHPCSKWARKNGRNYNWLLKLLFALLDEYEYRYNNPNHGCKKVAIWLKENAPKVKGQHDPLPQCMPDQYKSDCSITAYREYYINEKNRFAKWSKRSIPEWFISKN